MAIIPSPYRGAAWILGAYWLWLFAFHLMGLSLVTYGMLDATPRFEEIADQYATNYWTIQGLASLGFFLLGWAFSRTQPAPWTELTPVAWRKQLLPAFLRTAAATMLLNFLFLAGTPSQYLGPGLSWADAPWSILGWIIRSIALFGWALGDELVFRKLLLTRLSKGLGEWGAVLVTTALWVLTRSWNQPLGLVQTTTLLLLGIVLGLRASRLARPFSGAAALAGFAWVSQALFSLPLMGNEFNGIWFIKFPSATDVWGQVPRLVTGGAGGPLSSVIVQAFLLFLLLKMLGKPGNRWLR